jgi:arabinofuranosyltransferase
MLLKSLLQRLKNIYLYIALISAGYMYWAVSFIYKTSAVGLDGRRYFCLFDDAMISMRYAWNLAHGDGLVWNAGEYVEGITNMLMTLYMSIFAFFFDKSTAVLGIQLSGIVFMLLTAYFCMRIGQFMLSKYRIKGADLLLPLFFALPLSYFPLSFWALMGMETGMLTALITAALWQATRQEGKAASGVLLPVLLGLAFLTRPDAVVPIGMILLYRWWGIVRQKGWFKVMAVEAAIVAGFVVALTLFRLLYYGSPVPNTYVLKVVGMPLVERIKNGIIFIYPFGKLMLFPICIGLFGVWAGRRKIAAVIMSMMLAVIGYQVYVGGDFFEYWRMLAGYVPLLFLLLLVEVAAIADSRTALAGSPSAVKQASGLPLLKGPRFRNALVLIAFLVLAFRYNGLYQKEVFLTGDAASVDHNRHNVRVALALSEITAENASVGVTWAGTIPYYTGRKAVDFLGKSDPYIAALPPDLSGKFTIMGMSSVPGHNKYDLDYSIGKLQPTYVQTARFGGQNKEDFLQSHYQPVKYKKVFLWLKKNSPDVQWDKLKKKK